MTKHKTDMYRISLVITRVRLAPGNKTSSITLAEDLDPFHFDIVSSQQAAEEIASDIINVYEAHRFLHPVIPPESHRKTKHN
jgi:hypothetical protein